MKTQTQLCDIDLNDVYFLFREFNGINTGNKNRTVIIFSQLLAEKDDHKEAYGNPLYQIIFLHLYGNIKFPL